MKTITLFALAITLVTAFSVMYPKETKKQSGTIAIQATPNHIDSLVTDVLDSRWYEFPNTDSEFVPPRYKSLDAWKHRSEHLRKQILWAAGLWPLPDRTPLNARITERIVHDNYTVEKVCFESIPGLFVTGNLYRPFKTSPRSHPGVLNPHGHAPLGRLHDDEIASYQARCITFARLGCVAFMWDMVDYNDCAMQLQGQYQEKTYWNVHNIPWKQEEDRQALWNINAFGVQLWNSIRVLDFLSSLPEVDPERLACTGESGGATQTFMLAAVDERVKVSAPVCMISSYMQGGCNCENAPGLRIGTHNTEIGGMTAPRPMMLVSSAKDWTSHTPEVELPSIKSIYELYGATDMLEHAHFNSPHGYNLDMRNAVYPRFTKWLSLPVAEGFLEPPYSVEKQEDLLIFNDSIPARAIRSHETLVDQLIGSAKQRLDHYNPITTGEQLRANHDIFGEGLRLSLGALSFRPGDISYTRKGGFEFDELQGETGTLHEMQRRIQIPVWIFRPDHKSKNPSCALLVHGEGRSVLLEKKELILGLIADGQTVYIIEPFGIGDALPADSLVKNRGTSRYFMTFNRTSDAERIYDISAAIYFCQQYGKDGNPSVSVNVAGFGNAGPWLVIAGAAIEQKDKLEPGLRFLIDANRFDTSDEEGYLTSLFIPGVLRAGGLPNALALIPPCALFLHNTGNRFDISMVEAVGGGMQIKGKPYEMKIDSEAWDSIELLGFMKK